MTGAHLGGCGAGRRHSYSATAAPRVLIGWPLPLGFGLDGRLLLARRGRVYV